MSRTFHIDNIRSNPLLDDMAVLGNPVAAKSAMQAGHAVDVGSGTHNSNPDDDDEAAIHNAAYFGFADTLALFIDAGARLSVEDAFGRTPLHYACAGTALPGKCRCVELLLDAGADVDPEDNEQVTPLQLACQWGNAQAVKTLLTAGAYAQQIPSQFAPMPQYTPVEMALLEGGLDIASVFEPEDIDWAALRDKAQGVNNSRALAYIDAHERHVHIDKNLESAPEPTPSPVL